VAAKLGGDPFYLSLLDLIDELPLLVLQPATRQGWRVIVDGVVDNFQLEVLLVDALATAGLQGHRPDPRVVDVFAGRGPQRLEAHAEPQWDLVNWDGSAIAAEGRPADIRVLEGTSIVRLEPLAHARSFNVARLFGNLSARVRVVEPLPLLEVASWLAHLKPIE
jgi:hypothetical protein